MRDVRAVMAKQDWLAEILRDASEQVQKWPEWKRSDDVKRELPKLYAGKGGTSEEISVRPAPIKERSRCSCGLGLVRRAH